MTNHNLDGAYVNCYHAIDFYDQPASICHLPAIEAAMVANVSEGTLLTAHR
jgi:hypothetical protein